MRVVVEGRLAARDLGHLHAAATVEWAASLEHGEEVAASGGFFLFHEVLRRPSLRAQIADLIRQGVAPGP